MAYGGLQLPQGTQTGYTGLGTEKYTPPPSTLSKVGGFLGDTAKAIISPVATTYARIPQTIAALGGATPEQQNAMFSALPKGIVAPVPTSTSQIPQELGRGVAAIATLVPGASVGKMALSGASYGAGSSVAAGNPLLSKETAINTAIGGLGGGIIGGGMEAVAARNLLKRTPEQLAQEATQRANFGAIPEVGKGPTSVPQTIMPDLAKPVTEPPVGFKPAEQPLPKGTKTANVMNPSTNGTVPTSASVEINKALATKGFNELPLAEQAKINSIEVPKQIESVTNLMTNHPGASLDMAITGKGIPLDVHPQTLFNAVKNQAMENLDNGGTEILMKLAKSPIANQLSLGAQTMRASQILRDAGNPVDIIQNLNKSLEDAVQRRIGAKTLDKAHAEVVGQIKDVINKTKITSQSFSDFIKSIPDCAGI